MQKIQHSNLAHGLALGAITGNELTWWIVSTAAHAVGAAGYLFNFPGNVPGKTSGCFRCAANITPVGFGIGGEWRPLLFRNGVRNDDYCQHNGGRV